MMNQIQDQNEDKYYDYCSRHDQLYPKELTMCKDCFPKDGYSFKYKIQGSFSIKGSQFVYKLENEPHGYIDDEDRDRVHLIEFTEENDKKLFNYLKLSYFRFNFILPNDGKFSHTDDYRIMISNKDMRYRKPALYGLHAIIHHEKNSPIDNIYNNYSPFVNNTKKEKILFEISGPNESKIKLKLDIYPSTVGSIKDSLYNILGIPLDRQIIYLNDHQVYDDGTPITNENVSMVLKNKYKIIIKDAIN